MYRGEQKTVKKRQHYIGQKASQTWKHTDYNKTKHSEEEEERQRRRKKKKVLKQLSIYQFSARKKSRKKSSCQ